jgi:hypothetical protein
MSSKKTVKAMPKKASSAKKTTAKVKLAEKVAKEISKKKENVKFTLENQVDKFLLVQEVDGVLQMTVSGLNTETVMFITMELASMLDSKLGITKKKSKTKSSKSVN